MYWLGGGSVWPGIFNYSRDRCVVGWVGGHLFQLLFLRKTKMMYQFETAPIANFPRES